MAQQHTPAAGSGTNTVKLSDLQLVLAVAKLRRYNKGRTCLMAVTTAAPILEVDCSSRNRLRSREDAQRIGLARCNTGPMHRGHVTELIERTRTLHGLPEVRKTWGAGLRVLKAEPRHILNGGAA